MAELEIKPRSLLFNTLSITQHSYALFHQIQSVMGIIPFSSVPLIKCRTQAKVITLGLRSVLVTYLLKIKKCLHQFKVSILAVTTVNWQPVLNHEQVIHISVRSISNYFLLGMQKLPKDSSEPLFEASEKLSYYCPCFSFSEIDARKCGLRVMCIWSIHRANCNHSSQGLAEELGNSPTGCLTTKTLLGQLIWKFIFGYAPRVFLHLKGKPTDQETKELLYQGLHVITPILAISHQNEFAKSYTHICVPNITQVSISGESYT